MKLLLTTIAAVLVVGCGESQQSAPAPEAKPEPTTVEAPDIDIHEAARIGNIEAVKQHLAAGTDVNAKADAFSGKTPLHLAVLKGQKEIVELLIAKGADVNAKTDDEWTPLHDVGDNNEIAELLIAKGANVNARDDEGGTPLDYARGETADLLRKHGGKAKAPDIPIHVAVIMGKIEAVKQHIAAGTDVNAKNDRGMTPLDWAIKQIFQTRHSPAVQQKHTEVADLLRKHGGKTADWFKAGESIHIAASEGHIEAVKTHLAAGVDANAGSGWTSLHEAAGEGHKKIVELLITAGANVNAKKEIRGNRTPLYEAAENGHKEVAELLITKGADVNAKSVDGFTSLHRVVGRGHKEIVELLICSENLILVFGKLHL